MTGHRSDAYQITGDHQRKLISEVVVKSKPSMETANI